MKYLRKILLAAAVVLLAVAALLWWLPARWALPVLQPRLHGLRLEQVGGLLWHGHAGQVRDADGNDLGRVRWTLSRRALLGDIRLTLDLERPQLRFHGELRRISDTETEWHDVRLHADADLLGTLPSLHGAAPRGTFDIEVAQARLQGRWPLQLDATAQWRDAALQTLGGPLSLGAMQAEAHGRDGVLQARLDDDGHGPLRVAGQLALSPLGWRYTVTLQPRHDDPLLRRWLAGLGAPAADGAVHLQGRGGLFSAAPASIPSSHATPSHTEPQ